jgi:D-alanyl-D-alanine carboxypeptidase
MNNPRPLRSALLLFLPFSSLLIHPASAQANEAVDAGKVPPAITAIFDKPVYSGSIWGLRVVDLATGEVLIDRKPDYQFFIGSVRKVFTVGELINEIGPAHTFNTPVYREGPISSKGVLQGDLILVASGDLTMGGRTQPNGEIAVTDYDHNEANSLRNAELTKPDPLAGYAEIARQVAAQGIKEIGGDVVVDDRLFKPYFFRDEF